MSEAPRFRAVIFDMDGVLTDSEPAFHAAVNDILGRYGKSIDIHTYERFIGMATPVMWRQVIDLFDIPATLEEILEAYEPPLMARLREPRPPLPGATKPMSRPIAPPMPRRWPRRNAFWATASGGPRVGSSCGWRPAMARKRR